MTDQGAVIGQWRRQNETRGRLDRRLSAVDVQGEPSLNPRWHEMSMPAAPLAAVAPRTFGTDV